MKSVLTNEASSGLGTMAGAPLGQVTRRTGWSLAFIALLFSLGATRVQAGPGECSTATVQGSYGFLEQGTLVKLLPGLPPGLPLPLPYANSGIFTFDGAGHVSGTYTVNIGGVIASGPFTGTYTVHPNCTYSLQFTPSPAEVLHHTGAITGEGIRQELHYLYTDPYFVASGTAKKTPPGGCSVATLKSAYERSEQGTVVAQLPGLPPPPFPTTASVIVTYDGAGSDTGAFTANFAGTAFSGTGTATYTVNPDCTYSEEITLSDGSIQHVAGIVTGSRILQEVQYISTDNWLVSFGTMRKIHRGRDFSY